MVRGPKKHLKRLNAPKSWMLAKMGGVWAPKPSAGPHKQRECLPLSIILRNRLKYALTRKESMQIVMQKLVKVDGKVRTDLNFPAGFMDVIELDKSNERFRMLYDTKGRFVLNKVSLEESKYKILKIVGSGKQAKNVPYVVSHDGRTLRYPDPIIKKNDSVKLDLATGKIIEVLKFEVGNTVMVTKGRNTGRVGTVTDIEEHPGSFDIAHIKDASGNVFATRKTNLFTLGKNASELTVALPRGKGIKLDIFQQRDRGARGAVGAADAAQ